MGNKPERGEGPSNRQNWGGLSRIPDVEPSIKGTLPVRLKIVSQVCDAADGGVTKVPAAAVGIGIELTFGGGRRLSVPVRIGAATISAIARPYQLHRHR